MPQVKFIKNRLRPTYKLEKAIDNSKFIVLDEATSALDGSMEKNITDYLNSLKKYATIVVVAHRLSSIKTADVIIYLDSGKIKGTGNFLELQNKLPDFAQVVSDMGL